MRNDPCPRLALILVSGLLLAGPTVLNADPPQADLDWMAGHWFAERDGTTMEEHWSRRAGSLMIGTHRDVRPDGRTFFEYLRIEFDERGAAYLASPSGRPATSFRLVDHDRARAVFENPSHDYPQRIIYERDGDRLTARIEGETAGGPRASMWVYGRAPCPEW